MRFFAQVHLLRGFRHRSRRWRRIKIHRQNHTRPLRAGRPLQPPKIRNSATRNAPPRLQPSRSSHAELFIPLQHNIEPSVFQMAACGGEDHPTKKIRVVSLRRSDLEHGPPTSLNICTLIKRKPRGERSELLLCAPGTIDQSAEILYRPPDINAGFSKPRRGFIISIAL